MTKPPITPRRREKIVRVLRQRQPDLTLVLANIHDPHNVSAIYRSCDAFGVAGVCLYYTHTSFPHLGEKSSASARKWVETEKFSDMAQLVQSLRSREMQILATACSEKAVDFATCDFTVPTAILLGNEHAGLDAEIAAIADREIYIPMRGMVQSLNVSVAAAVLLAEVARQREKAGMYDRPRYPADELVRRIAQWEEKR